MGHSETLVDAALRLGILTSREMRMVPEVLSTVTGGSRSIYSVLLDISNSRGAWNGGLNHHACCYVFAKAVEAVVAWGAAGGGQFSVLYDPKHLADMDPHPEVPAAARQVVLDSRAHGDKLFFAHQEWVKKQIQAQEELDLDEEVYVLLKWISHIGVSHALEQGFNLLAARSRP